MSCGRTRELEAVVLGQTSKLIANELRAHAGKCKRCRHELNWLESESALFRQRAGRDEVAHLWAGVADRRGLEAARPWGRVLFAMAAAALLLLTVGGFSPKPAHFAVDETLESDAMMSPVLFFDRGEPCSKLPDGVGFQCAPPVPASFVASR